MTPEEQAKVDQKLREVAEILYKNTPDEELANFETIELSVRGQLLKTVAPRIGECLGALPSAPDGDAVRQLRCSEAVALGGSDARIELS